MDNKHKSVINMDKQQIRAIAWDVCSINKNKRLHTTVLQHISTGPCEPATNEQERRRRVICAHMDIMAYLGVDRVIK